MIRLLVLDWVRRHRWWYAAVGLAASGVWAWAEALPPTSRLVAVNLTAMGALLLGPGLAVPRMTPRPVFQLPLSRRQVWLARWLVSVALPGVWMLAAAAFGTALGHLLPAGQPAGVELTLMGVALAVLYTGVVMVVVPLMRAGRDIKGELLRGRGWTIVRGTASVAYPGSFLVVFYLRDYLPLSIGEVTPAMWATLPLVVGVVVASALHRPGRGAFNEMLASAMDAGLLEKAGTSSDRAERRRSPGRRHDDPFVGLSKLLWRDGSRIVAAVAIVLVILFAVDWAFTLLGYGPDPMHLLSFVAGAGPPIMPVMFGLLVMAALEGDFGVDRNVMKATVRHLRTLPISSWRLASVLLSRRLIGWCSLWLLLYLFHLVLAAPPASFRLEWLMAVVGLDALVDVVRLRFRVPLPVVLFLVLPWIAGVGFAVSRLPVTFGAPAGALPPVIGIAALATAMLTLHALLSRGSRLYEMDGHDTPVAGLVPR